MSGQWIIEKASLEIPKMSGVSGSLISYGQERGVRHLQSEIVHYMKWCLRSGKKNKFGLFAMLTAFLALASSKQRQV